MKREELINYMRDPAMLDRSSLPELEELIESYPWFQTARLLVARNHRNLDSFKYDDALRTAAAFAGDRAVLYHLMHPVMKGTTSEEQGEGITVTLENSPVEEPLAEQMEEITVAAENSPVEESLDERSEQETEAAEPSPGEEQRQEVTVAGEGPAREEQDEEDQTLHEYSFTGWFDHIGPDRTPGKTLPGDDLIERFLNEQPGIRPEEEADVDRTDRSEPFTTAGDSLMTETLAKIYAQQGLYRKAIYAYEKLSLKYPEKSTYFASQINGLRSKLKEN